MGSWLGVGCAGRDATAHGGVADFLGTRDSAMAGLGGHVLGGDGRRSVGGNLVFERIDDVGRGTRTAP